jgi:hypothetical protein
LTPMPDVRIKKPVDFRAFLKGTL